MHQVNRFVYDRLGQMTWVYIALGAVFSIFTLLNHIYDDTQTKSIIFFTLAYIVFFLLLNSLPSMSRTINSRMRGVDNIRPFWLQNLTVQKLVWIPIGIVGVFSMAYFSVAIHSPIMSILLSGVVLGVCFYRTHSILVPILIHGTYNAILVFVQSGSIPNSFTQHGIIQGLPATVPIIGATIAQTSQLTSEMIFQYVLVAPAEELMKMTIIAIFLISQRGSFNDKGISKYIALGVAIIIWTVLHTVLNPSLLQPSS